MFTYLPWRRFEAAAPLIVFAVTMTMARRSGRFRHFLKQLCNLTVTNVLGPRIALIRILQYPERTHTRKKAKSNSELRVCQ